MPIIPLTCPNCGGNLTVDSSLEAAVCSHCKKPYIVKDAVFQNYITNITNINADTVNVYSEKDFEIKGGKLVKYNGESDHVVIPNTVKIIGTKAFEGMPIADVVIPETVRGIEGDAFRGCQFLRKAFVPGSAKLQGGIFGNCTALESVELGEGLTDIPALMFDGCASLKKVSIPEGVQAILTMAFRSCTALKEITIPASVTKIGYGVFDKCAALETVIFLGQKPELDANYYVPADENPVLYALKIVYSGTPYLSAALQQNAHWRRKRLCQHCGGMFEGLLSKTCSVCGRPKDY